MKPIKPQSILQKLFFDNEDATQAEIDDALAALRNAVLVTDKSKLEEKINQAVTDFDGYTADSVAAYKAALARLNEVLC